MYDSKEQSKVLSLAKEEKPKVHDIYNGDKEFVVDEEVVVTNKVTGNQNHRLSRWFVLAL